MNKKYLSRKEEFTKSIRREAIDKIKQEKRKLIEYSLTPVNEIAQAFGLSPKKQLENYLFVQILEAKRQQLMHPTFLIENNFKVPISEHIKFWMNYSKKLEDEEEKVNKQLVDFMRDYLKINSQKSIHFNIHYELHILNTLEMISLHLNEDDKKNILRWVEGTQSLRVIQSCLLNQFLNITFYGNVYQIIDLGLKSQLKNQSLQANETLISILRSADYDDTEGIYQNHYSYVNYIVKKIRLYCRIEEVSRYGLCLIYLLDTFDECILDYARSGVGLIAAELITSQIDANVLRGMELMRIMSEVNQIKMIDFLLLDKDIVNSRVWSLFCEKQTLSKHRNLSIRKNYHGILFRIISNGQKEQVIQLTSKFGVQGRDIFYYFQQALKTEEEEIILEDVLHNIKSFLYYGDELRDKNSPNTILVLISQRQILNEIYKLQKSQSQKISQMCSELIESICEFQTNNHQIQI